MADDPRIQQLLEQMMDSGSTPEQACADCPDLLPVIRERWQRMRAVESEVEALFPTPNPAAGDATRRRRRMFGAPGPGAELPRIPGYDIETVLGSGGMGVVYKAKHLKLRRPVAIKMLLAGAYASGEELECLLREAQAVAGLHHPHIVQVYDVAELDGLPYFTMEFIEGGTLAGKLAGVPQPARDAAVLVATLARAVQAAHDGGIVHRDLKPANILLTSDGTPKIADFSLARRFGGGAAVTLTSARVGTPSYMAPEQVVGKEEAFCPAVDVYALGALLYETLTGRPPFKAETPEETHRQVISAEPAPPTRLNAKVPRDLETICLKCLLKEPERRYPSAAALADDLDRFLQGVPIQARPAGRWERAWRWARRNRAVTALIGTAALCVVLAAFAGLWQWRFELMQRAEAARWSDRLAFAINLQREGRFAEARAIMLHGPDAPSDQLRASVEKARADLDLVERLEAVRMNRGNLAQGSGIDYGVSSRQYELAFKEAGLGELAEDPERVADRLGRSPIRAAILAALDDWAACASRETRAWILRVARRMDSDPWRDGIRDQGHWTDLDAIAKAAGAADVEKQPVNLMVALGTRWRRLGGDPTSFLEQVQRRHPDDFWVNFELGHLLSSRDATVSIGYNRAAVAIRPDASVARFNLGLELATLSQFEEAGYQFRRALASDPHHVYAHYRLGLVLEQQGRPIEAIEEVRAALALSPANAEFRRGLREMLFRHGRLDEARALWRGWIDGGPTSHEDRNGYAELCLFAGDEAEYHRECAELLAHLGASSDPYICERTGRACLYLPSTEEQMQSAADLVDRALAADRSQYADWAYPYFQVAKALAEHRRGHFDSAISYLQGNSASVLGPTPKLIRAMALHGRGDAAEARHTLALAIGEFDWRAAKCDNKEAMMYHILRREAESLILPGLSDFLVGRYTPADNDERMGMLGACAFKDLNTAAARLYAAAFAADPSLASEPGTARRYNAACVAALSGCGHGADAPKNEEELAAWRERARGWLRADLATLVARVEAGDPAGGTPLREALAQWQADTDLAGLREPGELEKLPPAEQEECRALWRDVGTLVERSKPLR